MHAAESQQDSFIEVTNEDGSLEFWTGQDLRRRIDFAMLGLDLCLTRKVQLSHVSLRKSVLLKYQLL